MSNAISNRTRALCPAKVRIPRTYGLINKYSTSFHDVFVRRWSCLNDGEHATHTAKLLIDAETSEDHIDLRLILEYEAVSGALRQK